MDASQWTQGIVVKAGQMDQESKGTGGSGGIDHQKRPRPQKEKAVNCPRCNSINTKFCYYNNYSLSQPRYFCKTCRRYWTEGGTLRSVPVGGGSRKNKKSLSSSSSAAKKEHIVNIVPDLNPIITFPLSDHHHHHNNHNNNNNSSASSQKGSSTHQDLNLLGYGYNTNLILNHNNNFSSGFPCELKAPSLNFSLDGFGNINGYGNVQLGIDHHDQSSAKMFFPLHEDLKLQQQQGTSTSGDHHHQQQQQQFDHQNRMHGSEPPPSVGYWGGMLGGSAGLW